LGQKGIKAAVVISAGGKEVGEEGKKIEEKLKEKARQYGIRSGTKLPWICKYSDRFKR